MVNFYLSEDVCWDGWQTPAQHHTHILRGWLAAGGLAFLVLVFSGGTSQQISHRFKILRLIVFMEVYKHGSNIDIASVKSLWQGSAVSKASLA